ncbi:NmrA-like family domain-containing protein 1 [Cladophialophora carrionii]|uniref:NmrA-like family domain-containing protein 1 n=1 Tax=Cladophialophora carrionii TaxID=86049 RepID=A0A1C1CVE8_9EURO|nr:NmrA-like family domain-containing protein 1 [Cladophialophora carrionii]
MSKLLTVVGATGTQGTSLINTALKHGIYKIRGLTRNPNSEKAKALAARGVEMVQADINDEESLIRAFAGSHAVFAITDFFEPFLAYGPEKAIEIEVRQGINMARAASQTSTLEHYIWSTLPNGMKLTNGKYLVPHFEGKNRIDAAIRADTRLLAKTTFLWITWYGNNFQYPIFTPNYVKTANAYVQLSPAHPSTPIKAIGDPLVNIGIFAHAILTHPELTLRPVGRFVLAHSEDTTAGKLLSDWSEVTGKPSKYVVTSLDDFANVWPGFGLEMGIMMAMWDELRDDSWSGEEGVLPGKDLGIKPEVLTDVKDAYRAMDWNTLL